MIKENDNLRGELKRVLWGYSQLIQSNHSSMDENYKDRDADCLSSLHVMCS
jgi:hypothetical protein